MKKLFIVLLSLCLISSFLFGITTEKPGKESEAEKEKKIAVFGDFGFSRNINILGKHDFFMQAGAQYQISAGFFAEALFNYHFNSRYPSFFNGRKSYGAGLAGVYKIKINERFFIDLKAGILIHWNVYMMVYGNTNYTYRAELGLQGGPGIEYMLSPNIGLRAGATFNLLLSDGNPFWVGFSSGFVYKF